MNKTTPSSKRPAALTVPRDPDAGQLPRDDPPEPGARQHDSEKSPVGRSLLPDTPTARRLHANPPEGKDQLDPGTGGDAGRAGKEGTANTSIPPRRDLNED